MGVRSLDEMQAESSTGETSPWAFLRTGGRPWRVSGLSLNQGQRGCRLGEVDRLTWKRYRPGDELQGVLSGLGLWVMQAVVSLGLE